MKIVVTFLAFFLFTFNVFAVSLDTNSLYARDIDSGRIFYNLNGNDQRLIASTTKIMTCIIALENANLTDIYEVSSEVLSIYGSNIYLSYHEHMLLLDLLYGLMLRSGNDAAVVIANHVTGYDNFIKLMNDKAKILGMNDTYFSNPTGLDDDNYNLSSAHDLTLLYSYAYKNQTFREIVGTYEYKVSTDLKSYHWFNRNLLLKKYEYATGGKTGYTPKAGKVLVSSASKDDLNVTIASFNSIYDYDLHKEIYDDIFNNYKKVLVLDKDNFNVDSSFNDELYIKESFFYPLNASDSKKLVKKVLFFDKDNFKDGDKVGTIYVSLDEEVINSTDIFIKKKDKSLWDKIINFFK